MVVSDFFVWWYGLGWRGVAANCKRRLLTLIRMFSAGSLLRTLFAPWRRIMTIPSAGLNARLRAFGDNLVSRCIGFIIRLFVLLAAVVSLLLFALLEIVELILWPLLPPIALGLIVWGLL